MATKQGKVILWARSMFGYRTKKAIVELCFQGERVQMSPDDARDFALNILQAAEGAESDEVVYKFLEEVNQESTKEEKEQILFSSLKRMREIREDIRGGAIIDKTGDTE